jgi:hypothetical protein
MAGSVLRSFGQGQEALSQYQLAFELRRQHLGPNHRDTLEAQWGIGVSYGVLARRDQSVPILRDVLDRCVTEFGEKDELSVGVMEGLGEELQAHGEYEEGERLLLKAISLHDGVYPPNDERRVYPMSSLAGLYLAQNKLDQAERMARQQLAFVKRHLKRNHTLFIGAHTQLASVLYTQKQYAEVERLLKNLVEGLDELMPSDDWRRGVILSVYGRSLWRMGKLDEARPHMVEQYENFREGRGPDDWLTERSLGLLRDFMYEYGKIEEALTYHMESLRTRLRIGGRDQGDSILAATSEYTAAAEKFDRYPGDGPFFELLIDYGQNQMPSDHAYRAQYLGNLGWLLVQKAHYELAEPLLLASYAERKESAGTNPGDMKWLLQTIVELYAKMERADDAAVYQQALDGIAQK